LEPLKQEKTELTRQVDMLKTAMEELKAQLTTKTGETSSLTVEIGRLKAMHSMITNKNDKLKKELATLQAGPSTTTTTNKSTLTAAAPAFIPAGKDTPTVNHLKRASTDDLEGQPPAKK
jgi:peptidoglycan hydrolase CwlO-like protein